MIRAITNLKAAGKTTFFCLSNANSVYISTILKVRVPGATLTRALSPDAQDKGLDALFTEVVTNPAEWEPSGLLALRRRVDPSGPQHMCAVGCSANMCKGLCTLSAFRVGRSDAL